MSILARGEGLYGFTIAYIMKELGFRVWLDSLTEKVFVIDYGRSFSLVVEGKYCKFTNQFLFDFYRLSYDFEKKKSQILKIYIEQEIFVQVLVKVANLLLFFMEREILPDNKKVRRNAKKYSNRARW